MANSVFNDFLKALNKILKKVEDQIIEFAQAFLPKVGAAVEAALEELAEIALKAVLAQAQEAISGREKFGNAVVSVVQQVEASGKTVAIQTAQAAVQIAYLEAQKIALKAQN